MTLGRVPFGYIESELKNEKSKWKESNIEPLVQLWRLFRIKVKEQIP